MYHKILAAVNEHLNSEVAAHYALNLAKVLSAKLFFCFVAGKEMSQTNRRSAEDAVRRLFNEAMDLGVQAESIAEMGDPVDVIGKIVRHEGISLVFASTRREDVQRRFYSGTVARRLLIHLPCSIALVRIVHTGRTHPKEILLPLKARIDHIEERVYFAAKIVQAFGSDVYLLHSPDPISKFFHGEIHLTPLEWETKLPRDVSEFMERLRRYDVTHTGRSVPGNIGRTITLEAFSKRHDLIIMGSSERSMLSSILKGNPVEDVLRDTPCDLIILKPRHENQ